MSFGSLAQTYEPGLLVRSNGDTLRGELENGFWEEPPAFIRYRPTPESPAEIFKPRQLRAVSFTGGRYFRYEALPIDHAAETRLDRLPKRSFTNIVVDSLLADVLVEGSVTMVRVYGRATSHYLLISPGRPVLDMSARRYASRTATGAEVVVDGNNYHDQLALYFGDCPAAYKVAQQAAFTAGDLAKVVQEYNKSCAPSQRASRSLVAQAKPRRSVAMQGGVLGGVRYNHIEATTELNKGDCADCLVRPFAGLYGELLLPSRAVAIYGEFSVSTFQGQDYQTFNSSSQQPDPVYHRYAYKAWLGTARLGVRYLVPITPEQQLVLGFAYELNTVRKPKLLTAPSPMGALDLSSVEFAQPTFLPNVTIGWRIRRITLLADVQPYTRSNNIPFGSFVPYFLTSNFSMRLGMSFRLSHNPDETSKK